jgi:peptidoglycan/LPS O-acetylase OafA/YrhL
VSCIAPTSRWKVRRVCIRRHLRFDDPPNFLKFKRTNRSSLASTDPLAAGRSGVERMGDAECLVFSLPLPVIRIEHVSGNLAGRLLQSRFFRHLGLLSYSLYLFHVPVMLQLKNCGFREEKERLFIVVFAITYAIAFLSYLIIEKPLLMLKPKRRDHLSGKATAAEAAARP